MELFYVFCEVQHDTSPTMNHVTLFIMKLYKFSVEHHPFIWRAYVYIMTKCKFFGELFLHVGSELI